MAQTDYTAAPLQYGQPSENLVTLTHLIYALHAFALFTGVATSATILGSFVASLPSIAAVAINYIKQSAVRDTWLESHFRWQIRTFWFAVLWVLIAIALIVTIVGFPVALLVLAVTSLWVLYRIVRGWWALSQREALPLD